MVIMCITWNIGLSDIIALLSLLVSAVFSVLAYKASQSANNIQQAINTIMMDNDKKAKERAKMANLSACVLRDESIFIIKNIGLSTAYNINIYCTEDITLNLPDDFFPYPQLEPEQEIEVYYAKEQLEHTHQTFTFTWKDEFDAQRSKTIVLPLTI